MTNPPILRAAHVPCGPAAAFDLFTSHVGSWWPLATHSVFGDQSATVTFVDDVLLECALDGRTCVWGEVLVWDPPQRLAVTWHPGGDAVPAGRVEVTFTDDDGGTRVELVHSGWEAFGQDAARRRSGYVGPRAWGLVLDHYADGCEPRGTAQPYAALLAALDAAYGRFWSVASEGGFGAPAGKEWDAARVMAHMVANDGGLMAVTRALLEDGEPRLDNTAATTAAVEALVEHTAADADRLTALGRRSSADLLLLLERLDPERRERPVHAHLVDSGQVALDAALPWSRLMTIQAQVHVPSHTAQLEALRPTPG